MLCTEALILTPKTYNKFLMTFDLDSSLPRTTLGKNAAYGRPLRKQERKKKQETPRKTQTNQENSRKKLEEKKITK